MPSVMETLRTSAMVSNTSAQMKKMNGDRYDDGEWPVF